MRPLLMALVVGLLLTVTLPTFAASPPQDGMPPPPTPDVTPTPTPTPTLGPGGITQIIYTLIFPAASMAEALRSVLEGLVTSSISAANAAYARALQDVLFGNGSLGPDRSLVAGPWKFLLGVSAMLWPLTLAAVTTRAARDAMTASAAGFADFRLGLMEWVAACGMSAASLVVLGWVMDFSDTLTREILAAHWGSLAPIDASALAGTLLHAGLLAWFLLTYPGGGLLIVVFLLTLSFAILAALLFAYAARFALAFVLTAVAPLVITLSVFPATRWLNWTWLRAVVLVALLGPVNALLLKLAGLSFIAEIGQGADFLGAFVHFMQVAGMLSLLLTIDFAVIKFTFGAVAEIGERAGGTVKEIQAMGLAVAAAVGGFALGGTGAAAGVAGGEAAGGAAGGGAAGGGLAEKIGAGLSAGGRVLSFGSKSQGARGLGAAASTAGGLLSQSGGGGGGGGGERGRSNRWGAYATGLGLDPKSQDGYEVTDALAGLAGTHGAEAVESAADSALGAPLAAKQTGISPQQVAKEEGFKKSDGRADLRAWAGASVEDRLETSGQLRGPRQYSRAGAPSVSQAIGHGPGWLDFKRGHDMAEALSSGAPDPGATRAFAALHWRMRDYGHGFTMTTAGRVADAAHASRGKAGGSSGLTEESANVAQSEFLTKLDEILDASGGDKSALPGEWLAHAESIRRRTGGTG